MNTPPPTTPTTLERKKLTNKASGAIFAPAKKGSFFDKNRQILINQHVQQGLENLAQQNIVQGPRLRFVLPDAICITGSKHDQLIYYLVRNAGRTNQKSSYFQTET